LWFVLAKNLPESHFCGMIMRTDVGILAVSKNHSSKILFIFDMLHCTLCPVPFAIFRVGGIIYAQFVTEVQKNSLLDQPA
jgi:hypothetical protein